MADARRRGVVFDLDGTLVDSYRAIAESLNHAREAFGLGRRSVDEVRRRVGHGLESLIAEELGPDRVERGVALFRERYAAVFGALTRALPGVPEGLALLRAHGLRLAVASNKPARFSRPILDALGLERHFACVLGPDLVGVTKPDPAMLRACLDALDVSPEAALYVGDMVLDVETADRAGLAVRLVASGSSEAGELRATGRPVFPDFAALVRSLLEESGAGP